ncbi:hypothetical protein [Pedobacter sandarakinus]|uniref:hypothetical protein n=1 Tax=Pedobacter sandarakinus TaxID=353156 RepID=UPI002245E52D|nr:hypothetical protein [Pedobacter sandarakinus]MCX2576156.1 hypothetical protein [Pedobacter sandarakinus]
MKTNAYRKDSHIEGYVGSGEAEQKSDLQKDYEKTNEVNEVTAFGKEPSELIAGNSEARDGYDNAGTQGKDSLSDDSMASVGKEGTLESAASKTGSASKDFEDERESNPDNSKGSTKN